MTTRETEVLILRDPDGACYAIPRTVVERYRLPLDGPGDSAGFLKADFGPGDL